MVGQLRPHLRDRSRQARRGQRAGKLRPCLFRGQPHFQHLALRGSQLRLQLSERVFASVELRLALVELLLAMLLLGIGQLLLRGDGPPLAHNLLLQLPALIGKFAHLVGQLRLFLRELRLGFVEIAAPGGKLPRLLLQLLHSLFRHAQPFVPLQRGIDFLLAIAKLPLRRVELGFAAGQFGLSTTQLRPLDFQLAGPLAKGIGLLFQIGALLAEPCFPVGHFRFAAFDLGDAIAKPSASRQSIVRCPDRAALAADPTRDAAFQWPLRAAEARRAARPRRRGPRRVRPAVAEFVGPSSPARLRRRECGFPAPRVLPRGRA